LHEDSVISALAWNRNVPHILASASQNGLTAVWDLKSQKAIFNFQDSSLASQRVSLAWNPQLATQIAVAYDDERTSEIRIWDLRNP
jgi:protein transport protein SEC31